MLDRAITHITEIAQIPSFSSYEERLHPYICQVFDEIQAREIDVKGNNLIYKVGDNSNLPTVALTAHLDKINHYGTDYPDPLPVDIIDDQIEGAMDDSAGLGIVVTLAEMTKSRQWPNMLFFFSEMEEKKGLKEHPELLRNNGKGYTNGMGARRIAQQCIAQNTMPDQVITLDTTPLFKGEKGVALYANHWELNDLDPNKKLIERTKKAVNQFLAIDSDIKVDNNTNDYLHYGEVFNQKDDHQTISVALEPSIYPYHQKGERVFIDDIRRCITILESYLNDSIS
ncbi:M28 family peptidase [Fodinibius sp.]|uniref:M28 family peptidase n=1 Tax=Fodinibius sp. TaxID=1872440 RepID=UPI002ACDDE9C|nr:M28 family peptidase [Fodinibius sp.]MDZ7660214.1 M28 family peptidase [Fodinibius sp.]